MTHTGGGLSLAGVNAAHFNSDISLFQPIIYVVKVVIFFYQKYTRTVEFLLNDEKRGKNANLEAKLIHFYVFFILEHFFLHKLHLLGTFNVRGRKLKAHI